MEKEPEHKFDLSPQPTLILLFPCTVHIPKHF